MSELVPVSLAVTTSIADFVGPDITQFESYLHNAVVKSFGPTPESGSYITQRPGFSIDNENLIANYTQTVLFSDSYLTGTLSGISTGLANDTTTYGVRLWNGLVMELFSFVGSANQNWEQLLGNINTALASAGQSAQVASGNLQFSFTAPAPQTTLIDDSGSNSSQGTQVVDVGDNKVAGLPTFLNNDFTSYRFNIAVDGGSTITIAVPGFSAQTFGQLVASINSFLPGSTCTIEDGNLLFTSVSFGGGSSVNITDPMAAPPAVYLFPELPGFVEVAAASDGTGDVDELLLSSLTNFSSIDDLAIGTSPAKTAGRGIYKWATTGNTYVVNGNWFGLGGVSPLAIISDGTRRSYFAELVDTLLVTDPENGEGWVLADDDTLAQITDGDFPETLAHGNAVLNGRAYVMDETGLIYHSALDDVTDWNPLDSIDAERSRDGGVFIGKHHDHIVAFGNKTIEFFYDAGNPTGSVLTRRSDVFYNIGAVSGEAVWVFGDTIYFIGTDSHNTAALYRMQQFSIQPVSNESLNSYWTNLIYRSGKGLILTGTQFGGTNYIHVTSYDSSTDYSDGYFTFTYDDSTGLIYRSGASLSTLGAEDYLRVIDWVRSESSSTAPGQGLTTNGDLVSILDNPSTQDLYNTGYVFDYVESGYVAESSATPVNIPVVIRLAALDGGTSLFKFCPYMELWSGARQGAAPITISWSDTNYEDSLYGFARTFQLGPKVKLTRCGRFLRRSIQLNYNNSQKLYLLKLFAAISTGGK